MRTIFIQILLLLAITFNITHASIIAMEDHCEHESVSEYILEQSQSQECDDLCDIHHLFHLTAIIIAPLTSLDVSIYTDQPITTLLSYHPFFKETQNKPPIA